MIPTTIKVIDIISHTIEELIENNIYNLLVHQNGKLVDIRCRIIGKNAITVLILKLKDE